MTKPADSKQAIPSPEDRVRAIRERLKFTKSTSLMPANEFIEQGTFLLSLVEELKGQVASASQQPRCPKCGSDMADVAYLLTVKCWKCSELFPVNKLADFYKFFAAAPAEARKRKDYHAEYVEAVEAVEKAERERERMWEVLRKYAVHNLYCDALKGNPTDMKYPDHPRCNCGLARALTPEPATRAEVKK